MKKLLEEINRVIRKLEKPEDMNQIVLKVSQCLLNEQEIVASHIRSFYSNKSYVLRNNALSLVNECILCPAIADTFRKSIFDHLRLLLTCGQFDTRNQSSDTLKIRKRITFLTELWDISFGKIYLEIGVFKNYLTSLGINVPNIKVDAISFAKEKNLKSREDENLLVTQCTTWIEKKVISNCLSNVEDATRRICDYFKLIFPLAKMDFKSSSSQSPVVKQEQNNEFVWVDEDGEVVDVSDADSRVSHTETVEHDVQWESEDDNEARSLPAVAEKHESLTKKRKHGNFFDDVDGLGGTPYSMVGISCLQSHSYELHFFT
jgi:hypothetical protein